MLDFFFFNDTATTEIYTLSLHDALPISEGLEVLVQLVMAAINTAPSLSSRRCPSRVSGTAPRACGLRARRSSAALAALTSYTVLAVFSGTRSCGRRGPARLGSDRKSVV